MLDRRLTPEKGETRTPARKLSDIPPSRRRTDWKPEEEEQNTSKPMLQAAQETVARALGGTSRGGFGIGFCFLPSFTYCWCRSLLIIA